MFTGEVDPYKFKACESENEKWQVTGMIRGVTSAQHENVSNDTDSEHFDARELTITPTHTTPLHFTDPSLHSTAQRLTVVQ